MGPGIAKSWMRISILQQKTKTYHQGNTAMAKEEAH